MTAPSSLSKLRDPANPLLSRTQDSVGAVLDPLAKAVGATPIMGAPPPPWIRPDIISTSGYAQATPTAAAPVPITAYHKDALGYVHGKVALLTAAGAGANTVPFNIAAGWRPGELALFKMGDGGGNTWEVAVRPNGTFTIITVVGAGGLVTGLFSYLGEA